MDGLEQNNGSQKVITTIKENGTASGKPDN
jgi:hypothetical protein